MGVVRFRVHVRLSAGISARMSSALIALDSKGLVLFRVGVATCFVDVTTGRQGCRISVGYWPHTVVVHNGARTQNLTYLYIMNFTPPVTEGALAKI